MRREHQEDGRDQALDISVLGLAKGLVSEATKHGAVSLTYHCSSIGRPDKARPPYMHYWTGKAFARKALPEEHVEALHQCHEFVISLGKPRLISRYLDRFRDAAPTIADAIYKAAKELGVFDQLMVPVFGPHRVNGLIAFGFPEVVADLDAEALNSFERIATYYHNKLVRSFDQDSAGFTLSPREAEVLKWIARGKSNLDIGLIIGVAPATIDTYVRRIYEKMGVHDRVSAAVKGITVGVI